MPQSSFLGRVTKYTPRPRLNPAENRLTEVTAGVLEHVKGFAAELVEEMLVFAVAELGMQADVAPDGGGPALQRRAGELSSRLTAVRSVRGCPAQIRTQVGTSSGRFVDLEIRLRPKLLCHDRDLTFWVEVKHGAPVHGPQLEVYELDAPPNGLVLVVAPLQSMPDDVPAHVPLVPWQRLAEVVRARCRRAPAGSQERFILDAYADYLKEEELMDDVLTPTHALALAHHKSADLVLAGLCKLADPDVEHRWADRERQPSLPGKKHGQGWGATYPLQARGGPEPTPQWRTTWLEWGLRDDGGLDDDARHTTAFVAGASMAADNPVVIEGNIGWVNHLREKGFAVYKGDYQRVWTYLYPEQLLAETTLEGQTRYLAEWVLTTFNKLTLMPPPH